MKKTLLIAGFLAGALFVFGFSTRPHTESWQNGIYYDVTSDVISFAHYRRDLGMLTLGFQKGQVYEYTSVPESMFHGLMNTPRKGAYYNQRIQGKFPSRRVQLSCPGPTM